MDAAAPEPLREEDHDEGNHEDAGTEREHAGQLLREAQLAPNVDRQRGIGAGQEEWSPIYNASDTTWNALYPMVTVDDQRLYVAWTERKGEASQVKLRTAPLVGN